MALSDLGFSFARVKTRLGRCFVSADGGTTMIEIGRCRDVMVKGTKNVAPKDQNGREKMLSLDIEGTFVLTQTGDEEIENLNLLLHPAGAGLQIKFTDVTATTSTAAAAAGATFEGVVVTADVELDYNGNESFIPCSFTGRIPISDVAQLASDGTVVFG